MCYLPGPIVVGEDVPPAGPFGLVVCRLPRGGDVQLLGVRDRRQHGHALPALLVQPPHLPRLAAVPALRRRHRRLTSTATASTVFAPRPVVGGLLQDVQAAVPLLLIRRVLLDVVVGARLGRRRRYVKVFHFPVRTHRGNGERRARPANG